MIKKEWTLFLVYLWLFFIPCLASSAIYKSIDSQGQVTFSDKPLPDRYL